MRKNAQYRQKCNRNSCSRERRTVGPGRTHHRSCLTSGGCGDPQDRLQRFPSRCTACEFLPLTLDTHSRRKKSLTAIGSLRVCARLGLAVFGWPAMYHKKPEKSIRVARRFECILLAACSRAAPSAGAQAALERVACPQSGASSPTLGAIAKERRQIPRSLVGCFFGHFGIWRTPEEKPCRRKSSKS